MQPIYSIDSADGTMLLFYKRKRMEEGYQDNVHCYDEMKFVRILEGKGIWQIGAKNYNVSTGDILIMSRADVRSLKHISSSPFVIEQIDFVAAFLSPLRNITDFFIVRNEEFENLLPYNKDISLKMDSVVDEIVNDRSFKEQAIRTKLADLVITVARIFQVEKPSISFVDRHQITVEQAMSYIKKYFSQPLSLEAVAKRFYLSPSYFSRLFKQYSGLTFQEYVAQVRVNEVISLLDSGRSNVLDAAMQCGFSCSSGFYKTFRHVTGATPKTYKK